MRAPRNLSRLPHHFRGEVDISHDEALTRVRRSLKGWRIAVNPENDSGVSVSAEKGYLREAGNLVFHFSLIGLLVTGRHRQAGGVRGFGHRHCRRWSWILQHLTRCVRLISRWKCN